MRECKDIGLISEISEYSTGVAVCWLIEESKVHSILRIQYSVLKVE